MFYIVNTHLGDVIGVYELETRSQPKGDPIISVSGIYLNETVRVDGHSIGSMTFFHLKTNKHYVFMEKQDAIKLSKKLRSKPLKAFEGQGQ